MAMRTDFGGAEMSKATLRVCSEHAFHVDHNESFGYWDVVDEEGRIIGHAGDQGDAIALAIREAEYTHSGGGDVVVCVQQPDGHYTLAWSSV